ncbi:MAG: hypothetical protein J6X53_06875, partial [Abditibacteriota bacterium]|nr:hypothetical protein [Abditibacteriota bacterium]
MEFYIAYADGKPVDRRNGLFSSNGQYFTDSRGEITLTDIVGTIIVTEVNSVRGFYVDPANRTQTVVVNPDDAQTITFFNTPTQTLKIQKYEADSTTPISGVRFHITDSEGNVIGSSNGDFTTDRNGEIVLTDLIPGTTVIAKETAVPDEYVLDATAHSILIRTGEAQTLTVYNQRRGNLIVQKVDSATGEPLADARFKITTADGGEIPGVAGNGGVYATDRTGQIALNKLLPGAYVLTETQAPEGYVLNPQPQTILLNAGETKTVTVGNAAKGSLVIRKFDAVTRQPLSGAEFKVTTADGAAVPASGGAVSGSGYYVTDASGQITISGLNPAAYIVTEHKAPANYALGSQMEAVVITPDDVQTVSFYDEPFASLTILKRDSVTLDPLSGAEFSVKDSGGETIGTYTTGTDGTATVSGLKPNVSLVVTETRAPAGYVLSAQTQTVRVRAGSPNTVTFEDAPTGTLVIRKFIKGTDNEPLPGAAFKIMDGSGRNIGPDDGVYY